MNKHDYYAPCFKEMKKLLQKKGVSWKKATALFSIEEMIHWFDTGNMCGRVVDAVLFRIKHNKKVAHAVIAATKRPDETSAKIAR